MKNWIVNKSRGVKSTQIDSFSHKKHPANRSCKKSKTDYKYHRFGLVLTVETTPCKAPTPGHCSKSNRRSKVASELDARPHSATKKQTKSKSKLWLDCSREHQSQAQIKAAEARPKTGEKARSYVFGVKAGTDQTLR